ncbi:MAG: hypothetical protein D6689_21590 [Deltaproteobacteria bacterium]|nr:MAG: hypothetical protein D6689_21590 [Deltaproteobacteria bacterium]
MNRIAAIAVALAASAACADEAGTHPPGGGGGGGTGGRIDAGADAGAGEPDAAHAAAIAGRLCEATDLRAPTACPAGADFSGTVVANATTGDAATAAADGRFELPAAPGLRAATLRLAPGDAVYRASLAPIVLRDDGTAGPLDLPVVPEEDWAALTRTIAAPNALGLAAIVVYAVDGGAPLSGVTVAAGAGEGEVYYDDGGPLSWDQDAAGTGEAGVILIAGLSPSDPDRDLSLTDGVRSVTLPAVPIEADAITFVTAPF